MLIYVFVSSIVNGRDYDKSCVLNKGDCEFIKHPSYVVYDKMQFLDRQMLEEMIDNGQVKIKEHLVLQRVIDGALRSKMTHNIFRIFTDRPKRRNSWGLR